MKAVNKSVLIWFSCEEMFALVADVAAYPKFLPWCDRAVVLESNADGLTAEIGIAFGGIRQSFVTRNRHTPGRRITLQLVKGPFSQLEGSWDFVAVGDGSERACRIELSLRYGFANRALAALVGPVFDRIAATLIDAFVKRADHVYA